MENHQSENNGVTESETKQYEVTADGFDRLKDKFKKLVKAAKKLGMEPPTIKEIGREKRLVKKAGRTYKVEVEFVTIEVTGETPKLGGGWVFIATIDHTPEGNLMHTSPFLPEGLKEEHCWPRDENV